MAARRGSFSGLSGLSGLTLTPYGSRSGGLGGYNLGDSIASIEAAERYAVSVGWRNGTVTDDEYLDSLKRWMEQAPAGSREAISAKDTYEDALYTVGRNKLVRNVNNAATDGARVAAFNALISYDEKKLAQMVPGSEARRELVDRINSSKADIRATRWNQLVRGYNQNKSSNRKMLDFARRALAEAEGAPDQQTWEERIFEFSERIADDRLQELEQDYQHDRIGGDQVLAFLDARLGTMSKDSPRYADLSRHREDFAKSYRADQRAEGYETARMDYEAGRMSDAQWLTFLSGQVSQSAPGSSERKQARHALQMETFRIAEDRILFDIAVNGANPDRIIKFYRTSLMTMNHDSARAHGIMEKLRRWEQGDNDPLSLFGDTPAGGQGGGGGGGGGSRGSWYMPTPGSGDRSGAAGAGAEAMIAAAKSYLGMNYVLGAEGGRGIDCSGLVYRAFIDAGMGELIGGGRRRAAGYTQYLAKQGQFSNDRSELRRGDMVVYGTGRITHIGIYLGDNKVMSATTNSGVAIHRLAGISTPVAGFLLMDYEGATPRSPGEAPRLRHRPANPRPAPDQPDTDERPQQTTGKPVAQVDPGVPVTHPSRDTTTNVPAEKPPARRPGGVKPLEGEEFRGVAAPRSGQMGDPALVENLPGALKSVAREFLNAMGAPMSETNIRAVGAWLLAENPEGTIYNNNPFNLRGAGDEGVGDDGFADYSNWQAGVRAAALALRQTQPELAGALARGNDAQRTLALIERAGNYQGALVPTYNGLNPPRMLIGGAAAPVFDAPDSMADIARYAPDVAGLFEIDWRDPAQRQWFETNLASMEDAAARWSPGMPEPRWQFVTPRGDTVLLTYKPQMYSDLLDAQAGLANAGGDPASVTGALGKKRDHEFDVSLDELEDYVTNSERLQSQLIARGDLSGAYAVAKQAMEYANSFFGLPPGEGDPTYSPLRGTYPREVFDRALDLYDRTTPRVRDPQNPMGGVSGGSTILGLLDPSNLDDRGQPFANLDPNGRVVLNPDAAFVVQRTDGTLAIETSLTNSMLFMPEVSRASVATGEPDYVPAYLNRTVALDIGYGVPVRFAWGQSKAAFGEMQLAGYREPAMPAASQPAATAPPGNAPGFFSMPGGEMAMLQAIQRGDAGLGQYVTPQGQPVANAQQIAAASPEDFQLVTGTYANAPDIAFVDYVGADGKRYRAWSLDDFQAGGQAIITPLDLGGRPPVLVLNRESGLRLENGQLVGPDGNPYDPARHGSYSQIFHWYGTDSRDNAGPDLGARGVRFTVRTVGTDGFNARVSPWQAARMQDSSIEEPSYRQVMAGRSTGLLTGEAEARSTYMAQREEIERAVELDEGYWADVAARGGARSTPAAALEWPSEARFAAYQPAPGRVSRNFVMATAQRAAANAPKPVLAVPRAPTIDGEVLPTRPLPTITPKAVTPLARPDTQVRPATYKPPVSQPRIEPPRTTKPVQPKEPRRSTTGSGVERL